MPALIYPRKQLLFKGLLLFLSGLWLSGANTALAASRLELTLGSTLYQVELAGNLEQRRRGLMRREYLGPRQGMLLSYASPGDHRIWMKNMLISLWVYWIDENHRVIHKLRVEPCEQAPCPVYSAPQQSRYILELGDYEHPLAVGDRVSGIPRD